MGGKLYIYSPTWLATILYPITNSNPILYIFLSLLFFVSDTDGGRLGSGLKIKVKIRYDGIKKKDKRGAKACILPLHDEEDKK